MKWLLPFLLCSCASLQDVQLPEITVEHDEQLYQRSPELWWKVKTQKVRQDDNVHLGGWYSSVKDKAGIVIGHEIGITFSQSMPIPAVEWLWEREKKRLQALFQHEKIKVGQGRTAFTPAR